MPGLLRIGRLQRGTVMSVLGSEYAVVHVEVRRDGVGRAARTVIVLRASD